MAKTKTQLEIVVFISLFCFGSSIDLPDEFDKTSCPSDFRDNPPLIVLSMDGFRADYLERGHTPTIEALSRKGIMTPFMKPSYPSKTLPNHYTIVTGLLPPYHGIVANKFFDPVLNATFKKRTKEFYQKRFWGGEPIWVTAEKQGKIAATYFWPGSETEGNHPTYWKKYSDTLPFPDRVKGVLNWLDLPRKRRPDLINFYFNEPDKQGHKFGPSSEQVISALKKVDAGVLQLLEGLEEKNLISCVNLIILSDHGMAPAGKDRVIHLQDYLPKINKETRYFDGVFPRFQALGNDQDKNMKMMKSLSCKHDDMRVYHKKHLPTRWHLGGQGRIEEVILDTDPGFQVDFNGKYDSDEGDHGYDNIFYVMNALFLAYGPSFKKNVEVESFQNIEVYNLMCSLLGVKPAPNNGTWGALHHMLVNPSPVVKRRNIRIPQIANVPKSFNIQERRLNENSGSDEDTLTEANEWISILLKSELEFMTHLKQHLPWGVPQGARNLGTKLLFHGDHVTGYSENLRMPLWVSFNLNFNEGSQRTSWVADVRLSAENLHSLKGDDKLLPGYEWEPLFHPDFSENKMADQIPYLTSNAIPISKQLRPRWNDLRNLLRFWAETYAGGINVVLGTVFDKNYNTLYDDLSNRRSKQVETPTHLFAIVTRCLESTLSECSPQSLDVNAFIFPQYLAVSNCMNFNDFAREFSAKIKDVETITGLEFYPLLPPADEIRLKIRFHSNIFGKEKWQNRIRSETFGLKKR